MNYLEEESGFGFVAEPEAVLQVNKELSLARRIVEETGANLFLTGKAGTGKTTFLRRLRETTSKRMVVLAPTGVAAINAGGMTLHSFFQLPFSAFIPGKGFIGEEKKFYRMSRDKRRLIACLDLIVIDEISMVRPDTLDGIDVLLRRLRGINRPFGGVQLLLIGDLRQLAPVVRPDEWDMIRGYYPSPYFFESHALKEAGFLTVELRTIYRQQDPEFISLLNAVRDGNAGSDVLNTLNKLCVPSVEKDLDRTILLTTHNRIADDTNAHHLAMLDAPAQVFEAVVKGRFPESSYPADLYLTLKTGARVMFIKNDTGIERQYYNGLIGTVVEIKENCVTVLPDDEKLGQIEVGYVEWENISYVVDDETKEIRQVTDGVFSQIPLRLAWAITIHKSQGLTFDRAIIDAQQSFAPGQLYVALSRCRTMQGMRLITKVTPSAVIIDGNVNSFIENSRSNQPDERRLSDLKDEYFRGLLAEVFNFKPLALAFSDFSRYVLEYVAPIMPELFDKYRNAAKYFTENIENVGNRFISLYASGKVDADSTLQNEVFHQKIRGGCEYFLEKLKPVCDLLNHTSIELDNASYEKRLRNAADLLWFEMHVKKTVLKGLLIEDFSTAAYMRLKAEAVLTADGQTGKPNAKKSKVSNSRERREMKARRPRSEKKPKGYSQRLTLGMFRDGKTLEEIAETRNLARTTIGGHLIDMINVGELKVSDVLSADKMELLANAAGRMKSEDLPQDFPTFCELVEDRIDKVYVGIYWQIEVRNKMTQEGA